MAGCGQRGWQRTSGFLTGGTRFPAAAIRRFAPFFSFSAWDVEAAGCEIAGGGAVLSASTAAGGGGGGISSLSTNSDQKADVSDILDGEIENDWALYTIVGVYLRT